MTSTSARFSRQSPSMPAYPGTTRCGPRTRIPRPREQTCAQEPTLSALWKAQGAFVHHTNLEEHLADERKLVCYHWCHLDLEDAQSVPASRAWAQQPPPSPLKVLSDEEIDAAHHARSTAGPCSRSTGNAGPGPPPVHQAGSNRFFGLPRPRSPPPPPTRQSVVPERGSSPTP